jgi:cellulose synthase/poly-beta-1,6-N-acetylglucosamine synthase-like glycosyltransferase
MQAVEYTFGVFIKKMFDNLSAISVLPGPFSIYRRDMFDRIGLFRHAHNTEDMEIAFRMHAHGLKINNAHTASVYTTVPKTLRTLLKQRTRWSQGFLQNSRDYAYMYGNPRYGYFGVLVLPFGLAMFFGALYVTGYMLYTALSSLLQRVADLTATGVPLALPHLPKLDWFFLETGMLTFLICAVVSITFTTILLGKKVGGTEIGWSSLLAYFALYGFVAPLWLARAAWGALLAQESVWR